MFLLQKNVKLLLWIFNYIDLWKETDVQATRELWKYLIFIFSFIITILACLDRIRIPNPDLDPWTQLNPDPILIRIWNTGSKQKNFTLKCVKFGLVIPVQQ